MIEVEGLRRSYGDLEAVAGIDLSVRTGEVFALLGPNGAGKTTTVEVLEGYRRRDGGRVAVLGTDPAEPTPEWRARIGIVLQSTGAFEDLTPAELIKHFADFYPDPLDPGEVIDLVGLADKRDVRCGKLSGGQKRRLDIALGIVGNPELVFLDEPTTGLDPQARHQTWDLVRNLTTLGTTVVLTTHYLEEAEELADEAAVIVRGRIVAQGTPRDIGGRAQATARVAFAHRGALADIPLPDIAGISGVDVITGVVEIRTDAPTTTVAALAAWASAAGVDELPELTVSRPTLEDVYLQLIAEHDGDPA
ncbi:MAG: ABC transporter ATP-binding protein [Acidimicrobiales bacterium]